MPSSTTPPGTAPVDNGPCFCSVPMIQGCATWRSQSGIPEKERVCPLKRGEICETARSFHYQFSVPGRWVSPQCSADHTYAPSFTAPAIPERDNTAAGKAARAASAVSEMKAEARAEKREKRGDEHRKDGYARATQKALRVVSSGQLPAGEVLGGKSSEPGMGRKKTVRAALKTKAGVKGLDNPVSTREYRREKKAAKLAGRLPKYVANRRITMRKPSKLTAWMIG